MYDLIGDIHGYADKLSELLKKMGYENRRGHFGHPARLLETPARTYREVALGYESETLQQVPDTPIPEEFYSCFPPYPSGKKPVFIGHYWMKGSSPERLTRNIACLDYSVAKGGPIVAYRWDGEQEIDNSKFVTA